MHTIRIGLDIGSTTIKTVVADETGKILFSKYERHSARIREKVLAFLSEIKQQLGDVSAHITITGSIGMGIAERYGLPFIQEVVSATRYIRTYHPEVRTMIDIGGEDAKVVFFSEGKSPDLRMNGNCAGGTGAFIDQMSILLNVSIDELNALALKANRIYPIASRCGVFCKTDIQNLLAKNTDRNDIAASIFHAVAVQTVVTLSHGQDITPPLLFCGGPLTFIPALRKAFTDYLHLNNNDIVIPDKSNLIPAWGASIACEDLKGNGTLLSELIGKLSDAKSVTYAGSKHLSALFNKKEELQAWKSDKLKNKMSVAPLTAGRHDVTLGIDSGSTTTKIVVLNEEGQMLFSFYSSNNGKPIETVQRGITQLIDECNAVHAELNIKGSCSTGYGEDLIKAAFGLGNGIIETIAHYLAAKNINSKVSFILDIGGQDMKAIFIQDGIINHIEINEACSSGCGTFIETFAKSMNFSVQDFATEACLGEKPCDLGTRCTVFMNSKVKQVLREGATIGDIASGLSYSVINNCLHKVLKIKNIKELGGHIVVQGGTMHNDSVVRALELLIGQKVFRSDRPELMGAYGCALYAKQFQTQDLSLKLLLDSARFETHQQQCRGCENNCLINKYKFQSGLSFFSGNKCENIFTNHGKGERKGVNMYTEKLHLLFDRTSPAVPEDSINIGIPRVLNQFEEYPFWHELFTNCGLRVTLSSPSTYQHYEAGVKTVMSDNICFPAKLVHSHILDLENKKVDRIFFPYVIFEQTDKGQNSFNCPIVSGYSDVIRSAMKLTVPLDSPVITFKDKKTLHKQIIKYLKDLGIQKKCIDKAFDKAVLAQELYENQIAAANYKVFEQSQKNNHLVILLAGRPYHSDPLIQHKVSDMVTSMGADCITTDIVRSLDIDISDVNFVSQWAYPQQILRAAKWAATQSTGLQFVELTSFGCGPDAFMLDEIHTLLQRYHKVLTLLKIDDVTNIGSLKLRVRSIVDSLKLNYCNHTKPKDFLPFVTTPVYTKEEHQNKKKIIIPYFTSFIAPLIPSFMRLAGYDADVLPISDRESDDMGLNFANNEICYPATLIVGDIIKALKKNNYNPETTTVLITQTGGQCRASNYISLIKKALIEAGYSNVPVISLSMSSSIMNNQPGFKLNFRKLIPIALTTILYTDAIAKMYYAAAPREKEKGKAAKLRDKYLDIARSSVERNQSKELIQYLQIAARDFDRITLDKECPRIGIVGEIYLKFNSYAQRGITQWITNNQIEVEPPILCDFFLQSFVNQEVKRETLVEPSHLPNFILHTFYKLIKNKINKVNNACSTFRYFHPFDDIYTLADNARQIVSLSAQFGEGWLLPGEVATMVGHGITHVVSLQPFGCIANHIISKGIENRLRTLYPQLNFLTLDFDSGVSDVNVTNRLLLFANDLLLQVKES